jgi:hypothetical protein
MSGLGVEIKMMNIENLKNKSLAQLSLIQKELFMKGGEIELPQHVLIKCSPLNIQVCSAGTIEEAQDWAREKYPAGTLNNWSLTDSEKLKTVKCAEYDNRNHYVFDC